MANTLSHSDVRELLRSALSGGDTKKGEGLYIQDIFDNSVVYGESYSGPLYARSYVIDATTFAVTLGDPVKVKRVTTYQPAKFDASVAFAASDDAEWVAYEGVLFEAGEYPDKGIPRVDDAYLDALVGSFTAQDVNINHQDSPITSRLDGKKRAKQVARWSSVYRDGAQIKGRIDIAKWMHDNLLDPGESLGVSVEIDTNAKRFTGIAFTNSPRISSAKIEAAYAKFAASENPRKGGTMGIRERLKALFSKTEEEIEQMASELEGAPPTQPRFSTGGSDELSKQLEAERARALAAEAGRLTDRASAFADAHIKVGRFAPEKKPEIMAVFQAAVSADAAGKAMFGDDGALIEGPAVKALNAVIDSIPEKTPTGESKLFSVNGGDGGGVATFDLDAKGVWEARDNAGGAKSGS